MISTIFHDLVSRIFFCPFPLHFSKIAVVVPVLVDFSTYCEEIIPKKYLWFC